MTTIAEESLHKKSTKESSNELKNAQKWKYTLLTTMIFILVANPYTYMFVQFLAGKFVKISSVAGCPTVIGFFLHTLVFTVVLRYIMDLDI